MRSGSQKKHLAYVLVFAVLFTLIGTMQSWVVSLSILNLCLISAVMALGVNIQWGYAGLFSVGTVGFTALGGMVAVLVAKEPVVEAWRVGGVGIGLALLVALACGIVILVLFRLMAPGKMRNLLCALISVLGYFWARSYFFDAVGLIEGVDAATHGYLGGLGLPILISWIVAALLAAAVAWCIGKITLGLQSDYLAISTLGIGAIIIAVVKNEDWLTRGVKNVTDLPRPVPYEIDLVNEQWLIDLALWFEADPIIAATIIVKLSYAGLFVAVLGLILYLAENALRSPWGRMMRAIRDNPEAAEAMGKDVTRRKLQAFVLGSAVVGIAGAMLATLESQFTPTAYEPLRFTFIIWVMVIVGGSGNNWGSVIGAFVVWLLWVEAETSGQFLVERLTFFMADDSPLRLHLIENAAHMRMVVMGAVLLLVMRFFPAGLLPEPKRIG